MKANDIVIGDDYAIKYGEGYFLKGTVLDIGIDEAAWPKSTVKWASVRYDGDERPWAVDSVPLNLVASSWADLVARREASRRRAAAAGRRARRALAKERAKRDALNNQGGTQLDNEAKSE